MSSVRTFTSQKYKKSMKGLLYKKKPIQTKPKQTQAISESLSAKLLLAIIDSWVFVLGLFFF